jgi:hypothetical protein
MAISRNSWTIIVKFALIIIISAVIAGIVGGVTSQVAKWKAAEVVQGAGNATASMKGTGNEARMVGRLFVA